MPKPSHVFPTRSLASLLHRDGNNFDLIRLLAALSVMLGHAYGITGGGFDAAMVFTHRESLGSLAVFGFFLISGLLVTDSFARQHRDVGHFALMRVARIYPGAMTCALLIALIVGPLFTTLPLRDYFSGNALASWLARNLSLLGNLTYPPLPNVFCANRIACATNATAWTLPLELGCYVLVLLTGLAGATENRWKMSVLAALSSIGFSLMVAHPPAGMFRNFFILAPAYSFWPIPFFLLGMLLYAFKDRFELHVLPALILAAAYCAVRYTAHGGWLLYPAFAYVLLWVASLPCLRRLKLKHDYSYGIYLYGFVVQQAVADVWPHLRTWPSLLVSVPLTVFLATASWHFIERPCLDWARKRRAAIAPESAG